jgi:hypothetical protein
MIIYKYIFSSFQIVCCFGLSRFIDACMHREKKKLKCSTIWNRGSEIYNISYICLALLRVFGIS